MRASRQADIMANYTPLNLKKLKKESGSDKTNTVLIIIAILTACVLAFILILLIKQKMNPPAQPANQTQEEVIPSPPPQELNPEATTSPILEQGQTVVSTPTGSLKTTPTSTISPSP